MKASPPCVACSSEVQSTNVSEAFPLQSVLDLMMSRADGAAKDLGRLIAAERDAKAKLQMLEDYRAEYIQRFQEAARAGLSPQQWANYQDFTGKLDEAVAVQRKFVEASGSRTAEGQRRWLDQRNKVQAFDTLAEKHQTEQRYQEGRQEQKISDELTARKHLTKPPEDH
jgi:flagellar FliJ protein